jgi:hypothetical protein
MLKVKVNHGEDYYDYLTPFVSQAVYDQKDRQVVSANVQSYICENYGLDVPDQVISIVLKRMVKKGFIEKEYAVFKATDKLVDPELPQKIIETKRNVDSVIHGLIEFSKNTPVPLLDKPEAERAIFQFVSYFTVDCLRSFITGSVINTETKNTPVTVLVGNYVLNIAETDPEKFRCLLIIVQGQMLTNALLCPDLSNAGKKFKNTTYFLDTPIVIKVLGLCNESEYKSIVKLLEILKKLGASIAIFEHTHTEIETVIRSVADGINQGKSRGPLATEARNRKLTKADLIIMAEKIDDNLDRSGIKILPTPKYARNYQIDEGVFEKVLDDEISYHNSKAREYDINSVRSIYALRSGIAPKKIEKSIAMLITSNSKFAKAAYQYGYRNEDTYEITTVITDTNIANIAWLMSPMGASTLPQFELIALAYSALQPTHSLLKKFLTEIDKLKQDGNITENDHQILRSQAAYETLMDVTYGDESQFSNDTIYEIQEKIVQEIRAEANEETFTEKRSHQKTQEALTKEKKRNQDNLSKLSEIRERIFWRCQRRSKRTAIAIGLGMGLVFTFCLLFSQQLLNVENKAVLYLIKGIEITLTSVSFGFGFSANKLRAFLQGKLYTQCICREAKILKVDLED